MLPISDFVVDDEQLEDVSMGEASEQEYDTRLIFRHLYGHRGFYSRIPDSLDPFYPQVLLH